MVYDVVDSSRLRLAVMVTSSNIRLSSFSFRFMFVTSLLTVMDSVRF